MNFETAVAMIRKPGYQFPSGTAALAIATVVVGRIKKGTVRMADYKDILIKAADYLETATEPGTRKAAAEIRALLQVW
jgi:hypothetical protein